MPAWDRIVCVDWAKDRSRRQAWVAHVGARSVAPLGVVPTVAALLANARIAPGRTIIAIDAALGVPGHYLEAARAAVPEWSAARDFLTWLSLAIERASFLSECRSAKEWRHDRPFISVPAGTGSLGAFWAQTGGRLMRDIDVATGAKSPFIVSGIPGTVGSGTRALWCELAPLLGRQECSLRMDRMGAHSADGGSIRGEPMLCQASSAERDFAVWPFDGALDELEDRVAIAEIYPRVCYSLALSPKLPAGAMPLAKTRSVVRAHNVDALERMAWVRDLGVTFDALDYARMIEDDFDAMMSAAALLRCVLERRPLEQTCDPIEGSILGLASLRPREQHSRPPPKAPRPAPGEGSSSTRFPLRCPIDGCAKVYLRSRSGWDGHVGSLPIHPRWYPDESDSVRRKELFRREHASWFR